MRYTHWIGPPKGKNSVESLKTHFNVLAIGLLILVIVYQMLTRPNVSELERNKKQLTADLDAARKAGRSAIEELDKLKEGLQSAQSTTNAIGAGLDTGQGLTGSSGKLLSKLSDLIRSIPEECRCGNQ